ncbi:MAG: hypothetical protein IH587_09255 [Anaerolineae bacterium]|nr:hypothetical protein [Anaerolineae bacterium]
MARWLIFLMVLIAAACAPGGGETTVPTLTLIPATETETPTPIPPTSTPANLPGPQDVIHPTDTATPPGSVDDLIGEALIAQDPVAAELVGIAQRMVATDLNLPTRRVFLSDVRSAVWTDSTLNCPQSNSEIVALQSDGYRIVLQVGDQDFLFHTDFDRVIACDPANEQLPESFVMPTEEATSEVTAESTSAA